MTRFRSYDEIKALPDLGPAELELLENCPKGEPTVIAFEAPDKPTNANSVRAEILRFLILGGCPDCRPDERGVQLFGAYVTGTLDLSFAKARGATDLRWCRFDTEIEAIGTRFAALGLSGCKLLGLRADGARVAGNVFLADNFHSKGEVSLAGAKIGGQLVCVGMGVENKNGKALNAESARVAGDVFLSAQTDSEGKVTQPFHATGEVSLAGADIAGQLECDGGRFSNKGGMALNAQGARVAGAVFLRAKTNSDGKVTQPFHATGQVSLSGAETGGILDCVGGRFENADGRAFNGQRMRVTGGFFWHGARVEAGVLDLTSAKVGDLTDDLESWPKRAVDGTERLVLDGFTYDRIAGNFTVARAGTFVDATRRLAWLARGNSRGKVFHPQPYEQLGRVLGEMGHAEDRRLVLMERERLQRHEDRLAVAGHTPFGWPRRSAMLLGDVALRWGVGYGFKPWRSLYVGAGLIGIGWLAAVTAWQEGSFAPNSDVIADSAEWQLLARNAAIENPADVWSSAVPDTTLPGMVTLCAVDPKPPACRQGQGMDYEAFHALAYAVDVVVPLVVLGQEATWAPSKDRGPWGYLLWWLRWVLTGAGWVVAAFGAAAVTGLIRRE